MCVSQTVSKTRAGNAHRAPRFVVVQSGEPRAVCSILSDTLVPSWHVKERFSMQGVCNGPSSRTRLSSDQPGRPCCCIHMPITNPVNDKQINVLSGTYCCTALSSARPPGKGIPSEVAQWERAGLITLRSTDRNRPSLVFCAGGTDFLVTEIRRLRAPPCSPRLFYFQRRRGRCLPDALRFMGPASREQRLNVK